MQNRMRSTLLRRIFKSIYLKDIIICSLLIFATALVYYQVGGHEFISFDDDDYVTDNPIVKTGITFNSIKWAFGFNKFEYWAPLSFISHMIDCELFGMNAGLHHLVNLLFHIINVLLLYIVLRMMTGEHYKCAFVAGLFALHPVNVDSVAWVAERKNLLSTTFWLLSMLVYSIYSTKPNYIKYILLLIIFTLGLLAKQMLVTLPFVFLLLDYWPLRRFHFEHKRKSLNVNNNYLRIEYKGENILKLVAEKIPLLVIAIVVTILCTQSIMDINAIVPTSVVPMSLRIENAILSYVTYLWKMFWPINLTFYYPFPTSIPGWQIIFCAGFLLIITIISFSYSLVAPYLIVGWFWFLGTFVPVSGIMQGGLWPAIAERWAYVPFIGMFIVISWGASDIIGKYKIQKKIFLVPAMIILIVLSLLTWKQTGYWKNDYTLYSHALTVNAQNVIAHVNLGVALVNKKRYPMAYAHFQKAIQIDGKNLLAWGNLADLYKKTDEIDKAVLCYREILKFTTKPALIHFALAEIYSDKGDLDEALKEFLYAVKYDPTHAQSYYNVGVIYAKKGEKEKAIKNLSYSLRIDPLSSDANIAIGVILMNDKRVDDAIPYFKKARNINPKDEDARNYLTLAQEYKKNYKGKEPDKTKQAFLKDIDSLYKLSLSYSLKGEYEKALEILNRIREIQPDNPNIYYNIACMYARKNMAEEATHWLQESINKGFKDWKLLENDPDLQSIRNSGSYKKFIKENKDHNHPNV